MSPNKTKNLLVGFILNNGIAHQENMLGLVGSRSVQTNDQHHQASLEMEPTVEVEEKEEQLVTLHGERDLQLTTGGETVTRQRGMEGLPQGPMPPGTLLKHQ